MMRALSISELEQETGVGRSTIYYYISDGLLPSAQKASATRAVYDQSHIDLLLAITNLKAQGLSLKEIRSQLATRIEKASENDVDLVARQSEAMRSAILHAAAARFAEHGYEKTRVGDICKDVGITAQLLYAHFPSKRHLFIACWEVYYEYMSAEVWEAVQHTRDSAARMAWRLYGGNGIQAFSPDLQAMARVEAFHPESALRPLVRGVYERMLRGAADELAADRKPGANVGLFDDELVAFGFIGVLESMEMRASWDNKYTRADIMRNLLAMFLAVRAAYDGRVDLTKDWQAIDGLVEQLLAKSPKRRETPGER